MQYEIPQVEMMWLNDQIAKLNKKALKLDCSPITLKVLDTFVKETENYGFVNFVKVELNGETPKINGWKLNAVVNFQDGHPIVYKVPGQEVPVEYFACDATCEHCNKFRPRKDVFILQNENGEFKKVGRTCLKDFLGHIDPAKLVAFANNMVKISDMVSSNDDPDLMNEKYYGYRMNELHNLEHFLTYVACSIRICGWVSRGQAKYDETLTATADDAFVYNKPCKVFEHLVVEKKDKETAVKAIEWAKNLEVGTSDFLHNIKNVSSHNTVSWKSAGIAAAIVMAYNKEQVKNEEENRNITEKSNNHIGTIGDRMDFNDLLLVDQRAIYTGSVIHTFEDKDGNNLTWFCTSAKDNLEVGKTYNVTGRVKAHTNFRGRNQTLINRPKIVAV